MLEFCVIHRLLGVSPLLLNSCKHLKVLSVFVQYLTVASYLALAQHEVAAGVVQPEIGVT